MRSIPANASIVELKLDQYSAVKSLMSRPGTLLKLIAGLPFSKVSFPYYRRLVSTLLRDNYLALLLGKWIAANCKGKDIVCYTYWFSNASTRLAILKREGAVKHFISRTHRFDLYTEVNHFGIIANRQFQLQYIDKVFAVAKTGMQYLKDKYPHQQDKISCAYLGTSDHGLPVTDQNEVFTIFSCANLKEFKRVHLIVEVLKLVKVPVQWVHFGDGPLMQKVKEQATSLPGHISYKFMGFCSNEQIMQYYKHHYAHVFINVSSTEGLPVSIMEAMSFGMPVIATEVGGVAEIITKETGYLLDLSFDAAYCAGIIDQMSAATDSIEYREMRKKVREFWEKNLHAESNYAAFYDRISEYAFPVN